MTNHTRIARKITATLFAAQSFGSAGLIAGATVSAIVGAQLSGNPALAGLPAAVQLAGTAIAAFLIGMLMEKIGRRRGMITGVLLGAAGAALAVVAMILGSFLLFLGGLALFGTALSTLQLGRFAAAEVHPPQSRGRAISYVVLGGTVGSVVGPLLVGPSGRVAQVVGRDELIGPYVVAAVALAIAALVIFTWLRPDPKDVGREIAALYPTSTVGNEVVRSLPQIMTSSGALAATVTMVVAQGVMVLVMGMTSLHMRSNDHLLSRISIVIAAHTFGMFAFSIVSGRLTDRWGRAPVILSGAGMLIVGTAAAALSTEVIPLAIALFVIGLGWNFCYVGGSALLSDQLTPAERSKTQGANDLLIYAFTALVSIGSGVLFATAGYRGIGFVGAAASLLLLVCIGVWSVAHRRGRLAAALLASAEIS